VKLSCPTTELLTQLQTVARVASTRSAVQALSGVQMLATEAGAELRATDMPKWLAPELVCFPDDSCLMSSAHCQESM